MQAAELQSEAHSRRRAALEVLAHAGTAALNACWVRWENRPAIQTIRKPETGLIMVRGRAGGGGAPFNLGEATVSRASVRIDTGETGHGYCLGRDVAKAELIAVIDALFQREPDNVEHAILAPLRQAASAADRKLNQETAATKVDFFTMVRGDD